MSKTFRAWKIDEPLFLPPTVQDFVAEDHLARFVLSLVIEDLDLSEITGTYGSEKGQPPFDPVMMVALLLYAYCCGIYSSRRIAKACGERVDFMSIVGLDAPNFRTVSEDERLGLRLPGRPRHLFTMRSWEIRSARPSKQQHLDGRRRRQRADLRQGASGQDDRRLRRRFAAFIEAANDFITDDVKKKMNAWRDANPDKRIP